jgi:hypothetical protein
METGIQLAAIVLGVVPIFRTATGGYRTPSGELAWVLGHSRTALSRNQTHDKLEDFLTNLHYELSVLQMAVEKLVNELDSLYVDEKDALKSGSRQKLWTDPRVTRAVQDRLGSGYETFQIQVTKLLEQLEKLIAKDVGLQLESEKVWLSLSMFPSGYILIELPDQRSRSVCQTHTSSDSEAESPGR